MKQNKYIEVTARWKFGQAFLSARTSVHISTIGIIEQLPEETPDYQDGILTRIHTIMGVMLPLSNKYEDVMEMIKELQGDLL